MTVQILNWRIANANKGMLDNIREQYRDLLRPVVFPSIQVREQIVLVLVFANTGRSPAYRVRAQLDTDFFQFANPQRNIRDFNIFKDEIPVLAPGTELPIDLAQGFNLNTEVDGRNLTPTTFNITVSYASRDQEFDETVPVDFEGVFPNAPCKNYRRVAGENRRAFEEDCEEDRVEPNARHRVLSTGHGSEAVYAREDRRMTLSRPWSPYRQIIIETYHDRPRGDRGTVRARPIRGQFYPTTMHVECSRDMRYAHPVGTRFRVYAKETSKKGGTPFLYSHYNWPYEIVGRK